MKRARARIGTVGWAIPKALRGELPAEGSLLERYAARFDCVELDSTFYRLPRRSTLERWRDATPPGFRFAVKLPRSITHEAALRGTRRELGDFVDLCRGFGNKLGPLLVQLPGSLELDPRTCGSFLAALRSLHPGPVVMEPRHPSFFTPRAEALLARHRVARVAADPPRCPGGDQPGGEPSLAYFRLHGSPRVYYDAYDTPFIEALAETLRALVRSGRDVWCIFDNTALGAATFNALELRANE